MRNVYCDANIFIGWFNNEEDKVEACRGLVDVSEKGEVRIITSALTLTEVIKIKGQQPLPQSVERPIGRVSSADFYSRYTRSAFYPVRITHFDLVPSVPLRNAHIRVNR